MWIHHSSFLEYSSLYDSWMVLCIHVHLCERIFLNSVLLWQFPLSSKDTASIKYPNNHILQQAGGFVLFILLAFKMIIDIFSCQYPEKKKISVLFLIPCSSFKIWRPFIRYLMYRTVFYCVVFYFSVPQSVFVFNDAWPDWTRRIISVHLSTRGQFSHVWPEMNMCMLSVICSGILCYVYVLVFVIFFCCVCFEKGTFHK